MIGNSWKNEIFTKIQLISWTYVWFEIFCVLARSKTIQLLSILWKSCYFLTTEEDLNLKFPKNQFEQMFYVSTEASMVTGQNKFK